MNQDLSLVLKIQDLDNQAVALELEIAALPKRIAEIERALDSHKRRLEIDRAALAANIKERKRLEDDIKVQEQKISKLRDQILSAKTNEQYRAFQHEIEYCQGEIRKCEDRILDLMGESEPLDGAVKKAETDLAVEGKQVEAEKVTARERSGATQKKLAECKAERAATAAQARKDYLANYERLHKRYPNGIAVAEAVDSSCSACHMIIRPAVMQELRTAKDGLVFCESCKRILFYNPPQAVDEHGN
ncbi:MAG: hypothetical protein JNK87_40705 [Bryobacterales bacterium]|nr:hypothetical protein [Bryobacterales bacterium]